MSAQPVGRPYDLRRPIFELIEGNGAEDSSFETKDLLKRIRAIELQTAEIREILQLSTEDTHKDIETSGVKSLWNVFWVSQIIGLASLVVAELVTGLGPTSKSNLKFLGLGLTFIALECVFLAKLREWRGAMHGGEKDIPADV